MPKPVLRVIDSPVAAVVLGRAEADVLRERLDESLDVGEDREHEEERIEHRLKEILEAARQAGMSETGLGLQRASKMVHEKFRHV